MSVPPIVTVSIVNGAIQITPTDITVTINQGGDQFIQLWIDDATHQAGYIFHGIKISKIDTEVEPTSGLDASVDTEGHYYPYPAQTGFDETCFKVSNAQGLRVLWLEDEDRPGITDAGDTNWYYSIALERANEAPIWSDPKVTNEGDGWFIRRSVRRRNA